MYDGLWGRGGLSGRPQYSLGPVVGEEEAAVRVGTTGRGTRVRFIIFSSLRFFLVFHIVLL